MRRFIGLLFVVFLLIGAACGGGSTDDGGNGGDQTTATQPADSGGGQTTTTQPADNGGGQTTATQPADDDSGGDGPSTATVTIGNETYEFSSDDALIAQCLPDLFGTMVVNLPLADGGDGRIEIVALHEGTDLAVVEVDNRVHITIGDFDWWADPLEINLQPDEIALSRVESVEINGSSLTGTASFVGRDLTVRERVSMSGTFEATCGEPRLS